jgi:hypothetical protein
MIDGITAPVWARSGAIDDEMGKRIGFPRARPGDVTERFRHLSNEAAANSPKLLRLLGALCSCGLVEAFVYKIKVQLTISSLPFRPCDTLCGHFSKVSNRLV